MLALTTAVSSTRTPSYPPRLTTLLCCARPRFSAIALRRVAPSTSPLLSTRSSIIPQLPSTRTPHPSSSRCFHRRPRSRRMPASSSTAPACRPPSPIPSASLALKPLPCCGTLWRCSTTEQASFPLMRRRSHACHHVDATPASSHAYSQIFWRCQLGARHLARHDCGVLSTRDIPSARFC